MTLARHHLSAPAARSANQSTTLVATVCLHGFTQTAQSWLPFAHAMSSHCDVYALDAPGHGLSHDGARDLPTVGNDIADASRDIAPTLLVGYSMGARMALHAALQHPDLFRALILVSGTAGIDNDDERIARRASDDALAAHIEAVGVPTFVDEWLAQPMFATLTADAARREERLANTSLGLAQSLRHAGTGTQHPLWSQLPQIAMPTLIVTGSLDTKFTALGERMAALVPDARHEVISGAGHTAHLEQPEAFCDVVRRFIEGLTPNPLHR